MKTLINTLDNRPATYVWRSSILVVLVLTALALGFDNVALIEPFYALPIALASWYGSRKSGILLALVSAAMLFSVRILIVGDHSGTLNYVLEGLSYTLAYALLAVLITSFRNAHRVEERAADTDSLTGIRNSRSFYAALEDEMARSVRYRHVFSVAYMDIDNFKEINDTRGHIEGDRLLMEVASGLKDTLRETDIAARLGGDEFGCLFPETEQEDAKAAFEKTEGFLKRRMAEHDWAVGFSVGLVTFEEIPDDIEEVLRAADDLMYKVKSQGKNAVACEVWGNSRR